MSEAPEAAWYRAQGDPPDTVRWWDGTAWVGEPVSGSPTHEAQSSLNLASPWQRLGAVLIEGILSSIVLIPAIWPALVDVMDQIEAGQTVEALDLPSAFWVASIVIWIYRVVSVAVFGGTIGKLIVGIRVARMPSAVSPPGWPAAARRVVIDVIGSIPILGGLIGILTFVGSCIGVLADRERRSAYDVVAGTRVIRKS